MEEVPVPGVVHGKKQAQNLTRVTAAAGDVVRKGGQVGGAAADVRSGEAAVEEGGGSLESRNAREEEEDGYERDGEDGEHPFLHGSAAASGGGRVPEGHRSIGVRDSSPSRKRRKSQERRNWNETEEEIVGGEQRAKTKRLWEQRRR